MQIDENEIETLKVVCRSLRTAIDENAQVGDLPLTIFSNPFPEFKWLTYHPTIAVGGTLSRMTHSAVIFDFDHDQLMWWNREADTTKTGWHPITPDRDEFIEAVE